MYFITTFQTTCNKMSSLTINGFEAKRHCKASLTWHDRYVDPSRRSGHRSRAFCSRAGGRRGHVGRTQCQVQGSSSLQNPNTQATHAGPTATPRPTHGLCASRGTDPGRPGPPGPEAPADGQCAKYLLYARAAPHPITARAPPGVLTRRTAHPDGLCANHLGLQHRLLTNHDGTDGLCARGY